MKTQFYKAQRACQLFREVGFAEFADDGDLDHAGILQLFFNALGDFAADAVGDDVVNDLGLDHDAKLAARLYRVAFLHAAEAAPDFLKALQALQVAVHSLAARAGARCGNGVRDLGYRGLNGLVKVAVVRADDVQDDGVLAHLPGDVHPDLRVSSLHLRVHRLADVVQQPAALGVLGVYPQLGGYARAEVRDLNGMLEDVLAEARAELELAQKLD